MIIQFSSVAQSCPTLCDPMNHSTPSPTPRVYSNSSSSSWWCHPAISSSVVPFSSCPQSFPASGSLSMSQLFAWGGQSTGVSASASALLFFLFQLFILNVVVTHSISRVWLFLTPWTSANQASLSSTASRSLLKFTSIETMMLILSSLPTSTFAFNLSKHQVFSSELTLQIRWPKYQHFSLSIHPSNEHPGLISFRMDWMDLLAVQGTVESLLQHHSSKASIFRHSAFFTVQLSHPYTTTGKTIALTRRTFVGKVMSLLFNMLSRLVITFLPRSNFKNYFITKMTKLICYNKFSYYDITKGVFAQLLNIFIDVGSYLCKTSCRFPKRISHWWHCIEPSTSPGTQNGQKIPGACLCSCFHCWNVGLPLQCRWFF